ncbi:IS21 family transposase [Trichlorobacter lovleyi]|jgi:transposase|uniref:Integrase catalytic region n=1 Tax=Trichlorobacter lovleyi (strain ATCC BAA-1151 / DSM 17278 / SZ) TaxID=398767 RepID=B3E805_TRIL1|nr:IS21 family transposase [Trichlorobacter lovleyi]ACD96578.1 Integrase catalytic region [Trichlorobacter lovleyi SZ]
MLIVESIRKIRQAYHRDKKPIRQIAREFHVSKNTVKKIIRSDVTEQVYQRSEQPRPKLSQYEGRLKDLLAEDTAKPIRHRRSAQLLFEQLQREGFTGGYDSVRRFIQLQRKESAGGSVAFIPLSFDPGEAFQFDWSYEQIELGGVNVKIKVAQFRLCNSRMPFCIAYTRETLEMVLDAHIKAFNFFGGTCRRGIYDNLKTVVTKVLMGKERVFNRRFQLLASHYLFEPVACTPAAGWEKGQVENQVGLVRKRFFATRRKFADLDELNEWLCDQCLSYAASHKHPDTPLLTISDAFKEERRHLLTAMVPFDGYCENDAKVSSTALVAFDRNSYSVHVSAVGNPVTVRAYADHLTFVQDGRTVGIHRRRFGRGEVLFDPWHYLEVLKKKPGALRNGAPFKEWNLPEPVELVRIALARHHDGDRQFVGILSVVPLYGIEAVTKACADVLAANTVSRDVVLNLLSRTHEEPPPESAPAAHLPVITMLPLADCTRYDLLLLGGTHATA